MGIDCAIDDGAFRMPLSVPFSQVMDTGIVPALIAPSILSDNKTAENNVPVSRSPI